MAYLAIRSGRFEAYQILGEEGNPIFRSATKIREAIRLQLGTEAANVFAIPKVTAAGDSIDWYAPQDGMVVPWASATLEEKQAAKSQLDVIKQQIGDLSQRMAQSEERERKTFSLLLKNTMVFPGEDYVYLVDGKPVLTFWGFSDDATYFSDPLAVLNIPAAMPIENVENTPPPAAPIVTEVPRKRRWWWLLLLLLLLLLALLGLQYCLPKEGGSIPPVSGQTNNDLPVVEDEILEPIEDVDDLRILTDKRGRRYIDRGGYRYYDVDGDGIPDTDTPGVPVDAGLNAEELDAEETVVPEDVPEELLEELPDSTNDTDDALPEPAAEELMPEEPATDDPAEIPPAEEPAPDEPAPEESGQKSPPENPGDPNAPQGPNKPSPPAEPLNIPKDALKNGNTDFLNGKWQASTGLQDDQGRPIDVQYDFSDGKGQVQITDADGQKCSGDVQASVKSGGLVVNGTKAVVCPNGDHYQPADVTCDVNDKGKADCAGSYKSGEKFDVLMERGK